MSSVRQQQWSAKNIFCKQKSIDDKSVSVVDSQSIGRKILRKQLSVDHVTPSTQHASSKAGAPVNLSNLLWQNSTNEPNLGIVTSSAIKKRAQFAASANNSISKQELYKTMMKSAATANDATAAAAKARDKININIFLSQDLADDGCSDNEATSQGTTHKQSANSSSSNVALKSSSSSGSSEVAPAAANGKLSASARRAQFQSRRIMSAPIRPMLNNDDSKGKRKPRKKKVIRVNLTLNRDKDIDESPDEYVEDLEEFKQPIQASVQQKSSTKKHPPMRSRSILGCDQMGIETLVSMLNSGESDSEKEDAQQAPPPPPLPAVKSDASRIRANMLRKTVSFQEDDSSQLQNASAKDPFSFRRNSVVPFAGRMRNTRSLFGQEIVNLYMNNTNNNSINSSNTTTMSSINAKNNNNGGSGSSGATNIEIDKNENDLNSSNHPQGGGETREKPKAKKLSDDSSDEKKSHDSMTEPRELECWRLYEKMKKTGLNISYDTILRGILKPSELRLLEKQKKLLGDIEERTIDDCDELKNDEGP